jgi:3D (Asp-Asp-Asp) domain-containing protein
VRHALLAAVGLLLSGCQDGGPDEADTRVRADLFRLAAPSPTDLGPELRLWGTHYYAPSVRAVSDGIRLLGMRGEPISEPLTQRDWCRAVLQGSVSIAGSGGGVRHYAYMDADGPEQTDCDSHLGGLSEGVRLASRRARFREMRDERGCGVRQDPLLPYRTIAADPSRLPLGSVIFAPDLRGRAFAFAGSAYVHDGFLIVADRGGAVKGEQIDLFTDGADGDPLPEIIGHNPGRRFSAYRVSAGAAASQAIIGKLDGLCSG